VDNGGATRTDCTITSGGVVVPSTFTWPSISVSTITVSSGTINSLTVGGDVRITPMNSQTGLVVTAPASTTKDVFRVDANAGTPSMRVSYDNRSILNCGEGGVPTSGAFSAGTCGIFAMEAQKVWVQNQSSDRVMSNVESIVDIDASGGNRTVTLPGWSTTSGGTGRIFWVRKTDSSANTVTIQKTGINDLFEDGSTSFTLNAQYDSALIYASNTSFRWALLARRTNGSDWNIRNQTVNQPSAAFNVSTGTLNTVTVSSNTYLPGATFYHGAPIEFDSPLRFRDSAGTGYAGFQSSPTVSTSYTILLPDAPGTLNQVLKIAAVSGSSVSVTFADVTGTGDAVLAATQTWTGGNTVAAQVTISSNVVLSNGQGSAGQCFQSQGGSAPSWGACGGGGNPDVKTKTANYTLTTSDAVILGDATSGSFTLILPTAVGNSGKTFYIKKIDASANTVTIDGNGLETIDGDIVQEIEYQNTAVTLISDGSNWYVF
jgi:hypothetical protein